MSATTAGTYTDDGSFLAVAERIAKAKRLGTDPVVNVDVSGKPLKGSALEYLVRLRERTIDTDTLLQQPPAKWHIRDLIVQGQFGLLGGAWKGGKTLTAIHVANCVTLKLPWAPPPKGSDQPFGEVEKAGNALYIASEGGGALRNRADAWQRLHDPDGKLRAASPYKIYWFRDRYDLLDPVHVEAIKAFCVERQIVFLVVDTLAAALNGAGLSGQNPENDNAYMTALMNSAAEIAEHFGGSGFFVCHPSKGDDESTRGAGAIEATARFKLHVGEKSGGRFVKLQFSNDAPDGPESFFEIAEVEVGTDDRGKPILAPAYKPTSGPYVASVAPQELDLLRGIVASLDGEGRITRADMKDVAERLKIKAHRPVINRLHAQQYIEGVGDKDGRGSYHHYTVTAAGRKRAAVTLGESRLPADQRNREPGPSEHRHNDVLTDDPF